MTLREQILQARKEFHDALDAFNNATPEYVDAAIHAMNAAAAKLDNLIREFKASEDETAEDETTAVVAQPGKWSWLNRVGTFLGIVKPDGYLQ